MSTISPRCDSCDHQRGSHLTFEPFGCYKKGCACPRYVPRRVSVRRSPLQRASAPSKRKTMPRCKHCGHGHRRHTGGPSISGGGHCICVPCPGYEPARGIRQKRRTPQAAIRRIADGLWADVVHARLGGCEVQRYHAHPCGGSLQAMHGIPRTFSATRWLPINGFRGCADVHYFFTKRPEAWSATLLEAWGLETFRELWALARASQPVDMDKTVASLRAELARKGTEVQA